MHGGRSEEKSHNIQYCSGSKRSPVVYAAKADCRRAMPMMARSMLVTTGHGWKGKTNLDGEDCRTNGIGTKAILTCIVTRPRGRRRIVESRSLDSSSSQEGMKERRRHDSCNAHSLDPATHWHAAAAGSIRGYRDRSAGRLVDRPVAVALSAASRCASFVQSNSDMVSQGNRGFCVVGSSLSSPSSPRANVCLAALVNNTCGIASAVRSHLAVGRIGIHL
jgi:hypothetical protein